ncbi:MAG: CBS domain-containing protein [Candidatus Caldarchaeum sp.]
MKARDIMTKNVISVDENMSVREAVNVMAQHNIGALIIQTPKPTFGIFTQGDLVERVIAPGRNPDTTKIREVMTESTKCVQADDDMDEIAEIMYEETVKYLPVMDGRKLVGIISNVDLFRAMFRASEGYKEEVV